MNKKKCMIYSFSRNKINNAKINLKLLYMRLTTKKIENYQKM